MDTCLQELTLEELKSYAPVIGVTDAAGQKVGQVEKDLLLYLLSMSASWMLAEIMDRFQEAVIAIDRHGRIFYLNSSYSKILGVSLGRLIGRDIRQVEPGAEIINVLEKKIPVFQEKQYIKTLDKYVSARIYPLERGSEFLGVVSIFQDTTVEVKLGEAVAKANEIALNYQRQAEAQEQMSRLEIIGKSPAFMKTVSQALIVAKTEASVLIKGENGAGKEMIAKIIHENSGRKTKPMILVNCAAIPENLIESELFGYEEGSFTGAKAGGKMGKFELANGGTLFLDEIGDMPMAMQAKLLRVLQAGEIEKIGRQRNIPVNVRLIAATNQPLEQMIQEKTFRQDLYFRLNIVEIDVPSLKERREDIGLLANHFLQVYNRRYEKKLTFSHEVLTFLHTYSWPGNVRELKNCMEYAVIMCSGELFGISHLPPHMKQLVGSEEAAGAEVMELAGASVQPVGQSYQGGPLREALGALEKKILIEAIAQNRGSKVRAMKELEVSKRTFYRKLKEYGINGSEKDT
ncbi:PAS domain S-box protein [Aminipila butyrica]|uniref:PAS domain S-box protein n=2 Tax=Aminipila butyrica TaxID=433296 RepID=A0A858BXF9_9FIRM|nr:PAS domain S-box protein [Aminipila butyrica]